MNFRWFGFKLGRATIGGKTVVAAQAHRRMSASAERAQGVGLGQIGLRHLLYLGHRADTGLHVCLGFVWFTAARP